MRLSAWTAVSSSLVVISAALVILLATNALVRDRLRADVSMRLQAQLDQEIALLHARLDGVGANVAAIAQGPVLQTWLEADRDGTRRDDLRKKVDGRLASMVATHPQYFQLRFLDATGHERARVDRRDGKVIILPEADLQDKSKRDYVPPMLALQPDEIYVSPLDLNQEGGVIERPLRPTIRIAAPVFDADGRRQGGVIVNLDAEVLLPPRELGGVHFLVVDEHGAFLRHPDPGHEFGLQLGSGVTLVRDHGEAASKLHQRLAGVEQLSRGLAGSESELIAFKHVTYDPSAPARRWLMIVAQPQSLAYAPIQSLTRKLVAVVLGVAMLACAIGWLSAYRVTRPLNHIIGVARRITSGDLQSETEVQGGREVAELGVAFNVMTLRLRRMIDDERRASQELSRVNLELERANLELQRSNQELADFAHAASHDLRTPLRALRALPEWIQDDLTDIDVPDDVHKHLETMQAQSERMEGVINNLLEYARVGRAESRPQSFDPQDVVQRVLRFLALPDRFAIELVIEPRRITAVLAEFELIVRNLVQNAVAHHDRKHGTIRIAGTYCDDALVFEVSDDGPGIPPEYHERVLLPFHSLKRRDEGGGSGLGLALVNKIVQRAAGRIEIVSQAGARGTLFRIVLPAQPASPQGENAISMSSASAAAA